MSADPTALLRRIAQGDERALEALYDAYASRVYGLALRVMGDESLAQEVTQDVFLKVWQRPHTWNPERGQFSSWLLTVARYTAVDRLRAEALRSGRSVPLLDEFDAPTDADPDPAEHDRLRALLRRLPDEQRQVIELAYFRGLTHSELAAALNLPLGTVKTRLRAGLQKLRALLINPNDHE
ncbi:sigma-70 family RNA polymerase sigma factor [Aggregatilineales bacterium SYSU G02658]